jgi:hypothetical protein
MGIAHMHTLDIRSSLRRKSPTRWAVADDAAPLRIGSRITDKSALPDEGAIREWLGPEAFGRWTELRNWIDSFYPGVFEPDWLYGGKNRGWSLRYKKVKAFCTLMPEYGRLSALVVMGGAEREKFEQRRHAWRPPLVQLYDEARTYIDGKWLTVAISSADDLSDVKELLMMKLPPPAHSHSLP